MSRVLNTVRSKDQALRERVERGEGSERDRENYAFMRMHEDARPEGYLHMADTDRPIPSNTYAQYVNGFDLVDESLDPSWRSMNLGDSIGDGRHVGDIEFNPDYKNVYRTLIERDVPLDSPGGFLNNDLEILLPYLLQGTMGHERTGHGAVGEYLRDNDHHISTAERRHGRGGHGYVYREHADALLEMAEQAKWDGNTSLAEDLGRIGRYLRSRSETYYSNPRDTLQFGWSRAEYEKPGGSRYGDTLPTGPSYREVRDWVDEVVGSHFGDSEEPRVLKTQ